MTEPGAPARPAEPPEDDARIETVIAPRPGWKLVDAAELWRYRELLGFLTWRDVKVRYKQTALGAAWAVLQPLAMMAVLSVSLAQVEGVSGSVEHYPLFVLTGLVAWLFFSGAVSSGANSLVGNQSLVTKVYFPRLLLPISAGGVALVDLGVALVLLAAVMAGYGVVPGAAVVIWPAALFLLTVAALGIGILLAALTVAYRDFRYVVPFAMQLWLFATPSVYLPVDSVLGPTARSVLPVNPAYGLILAFRTALLGGPIDWYAFAVSGLVALGLFAAGCLYFRRTERTFADII
jgi:lipopolysaccharide transport system permease protein